MSDERMVRANGVDPCVRTSGVPGDPAILLLAGMASPMDVWPDEFCARLAEAGRFVIRYDYRDTGRSVTYPPGAPDYTFRDLVADALGLLDVFGVGTAHLVGISMGGGLAQVIGVEHPDRVASLTLMSTSPGPGPDSGLPGVADRLTEHFAVAATEPDWADRTAVVEHIMRDFRAYAGTIPPDEAELRELAERIVDRATDVRSTQGNHALIDDGGGEPVRPRLGQITAPTLVIHGTEDPLFPLAHGEALAREIPGARLLPLAGAGHELPPRPHWDAVITALVAHTN
jgi:pimeloyl-ACP methyl ester carboxylesterase